MTGQSLLPGALPEQPPLPSGDSAQLEPLPPDPLWVGAGGEGGDEPYPFPEEAADDASSGWASGLRRTAAIVLLASLTAVAPSPRSAADATALTSVRVSLASVPLSLSSRSTLPDMVLPLDAENARLINFKRPFDTVPELASPWRFALTGVDRDRALDCLAAAAWYEAGDDPAGERAVIQVVLNRARHPSYPSTVCGVVFEGSTRATGCQFTFTCDGAMARTPAPTAWLRARALASVALDGGVDARVGAATHYHADYVVPVWAPRLTKLAQVGAHIFYRFPGNWGSQGVWRKSRAADEPEIAQLARFGGGHVAGADAAAGITAASAPGTTPGTTGAALALPLPAQPGAGGVGLTPVIAAPAKPQESAILMAVDAAAPPGRWAMEAMGRCRGQRDCQVIAWSAGQQFDINRNLPRTLRTTPLFLYIRDAASGMAVTLWDCSVAPRPDASQCLPTQPGALAHLMRPRH